VHIQRYIPDLTISYQPDGRQAIAESWPQSINGQCSAVDWDWKHEYDLADIVADMLWHLGDDALKTRVEALRPQRISTREEIACK
jgi:hypothetical protein